MANIIVNTLEPFYSQVTANRGVLGLGLPVVGRNTQNPDIILVSQDVISRKLAKLRALKTEFENYSGADLNNIDNEYGTAKDEDAVIYYFRYRLVRILFSDEGQPTPQEASGNKGGSWFNAYNDLPYKVFAPDDRFEARRVCVRIATDWVQLLQNILDYRSGLAERPPAPERELRQGFDNSSRVENIFGTITVNISTVQLPLTSAILSASRALVSLKTLQFFDEKKEYKTIINFGSDRQYLAEAWRPVPSDSSSIQVKLLTPLREDIQVYNPVYVGLEFAKSVIDNLTIELPPEVDTTPYLRPANTNVGKFAIDKQTINNVTLSTLGLLTGSVGAISASTISYDDRVFNRWFTSDFNSSELNVDFSDYNNFVFFGSAKARLNTFVNKLNKIQSIGNKISVSSSNVSERKNSVEVELIKRNFDLYEQYLYFASQSNAYSASVYYVDGGAEYNPTGSWPKDSNMNPLSYVNVESWYATQSAIAERFDEFNPNYLVKHLPEHIQEDSNSTDFITFIQMFGHVMDNIKIYIDQFPNIYSTSPDPFNELTMDQVYEVAKSFGMELPNAFSLETLQTFISSLYDGTGARSFVAETWKRFLHSSPYIKKLKGSRTGVDTVINTYGLNSPLVQVKESTYAVDGNYIKSDELVYALQLTGSRSSSVWIPFVSSSYSASTLQVRFIPEQRKQSSLLTTNGTWGIELVPHPSASTTSYFNTQSIRVGTSYFTLNVPTKNYGRIHVVSGSGRTIIASSSYFPLFSDTYTHIMLRSQSQDITIMQSDGDQILHQESASVSLGSLWNSTYVYLGGTGSLRFTNFDGVIDDVRVWGEETTKDNFIKQVYDPGSYYGSTYSSSYNSLYVDLSFSQKYAAITQSATNESPFSGVSNILNIPAYGFTTASYVRVLRTIKQFTPVVGSSIFSNRKVTVADPPTFNENFIDSDGVTTLRVNNSIKSVEDKKYVGGQDYIQFAVSPTDFVNQTIMRSMGDIDTNYLIGSPSKYENETYTELETIFEFFLKNYNDNINVNEYIRFFSNVLKAPSEYIETYVPARSKLVNGIVIESPFLKRRKERIQKSIRVDGSNTKIFQDFVSGSGSANVGAYDFYAEYPKEPERDTTIITNPVVILQQIGVQTVTSSLASRNGGIGMVSTTIDNSYIGPVSSTISSKLPPGKQLLQKIGPPGISSSGYVTSSLADSNSGIGFIDAELDALPREFVTQSGYTRNLYKGLQYLNSTIYRISSEENTIEPFYTINPVSDFTDVGTTTYFYNAGGVYKLPSIIGKPKEYKFNKQFYLAKLDIPIGEIESAEAKELNKITLLPTNSLADYPGRFDLTIATKTYTVGQQYVGILNIPNIFSLYRIKGTTGLRLRLYRNIIDQTNDLSRPFTTIPTSTSGVLFDGLLQTDNTVFPYTLIQTENSTIYFTIDNVGSTSLVSDVILTAFAYEPTNSIPIGYLPRHYKFTRTTNTPTLRRNYLGCRTVYCPEGCPPDITDSAKDSPVIIYQSPRTSPTVVNQPGGIGQRTQPGGDVIKFGGNGPLK